LREVQVVHVDIQARTVAPKFLFGILKQESGFAYTTCALDADKPVVPIYLVHQVSADRGIGVLHQVAVRSIEGFHELLFIGCKYNNTSKNCKVDIAKCVKSL
jgi:hypothetical protein